jgi:hypothetical protein
MDREKVDEIKLMLEKNKLREVDKSQVEPTLQVNKGELWYIN